MFNIGFSELVLILLVAFVIVGPKDLPKVARALGRWIKTIKKAVFEFKQETGLDEALDELKKTERDLKQTLDEANPAKELEEVSKETEKAIREAQRAVKEAEQAVKEAKRDAEDGLNKIGNDQS